MNEVRRAQYLSSCVQNTTPTHVYRAALEEARENRKFEIDLYWKRAAYFWVFIAAAFAGYSALQEKHRTIAFLIACLGFIFSLAWHFVNRGSKFWQQNWELHVDLLEDDVAGPIYKTVVQRTQYEFCNLNGAYPFSVSKINQLLSLFVTVAWLILIAKSFIVVWGIQFCISPHIATLVMLLGTLTAAVVLVCLVARKTFKVTCKSTSFTNQGGPIFRKANL